MISFRLIRANGTIRGLAVGWPRNGWMTWKAFRMPSHRGL